MPSSSVSLRAWAAVLMHAVLCFPTNTFASAASLQPSLRQASNAVGGKLADKHFHSHKMGSRVKGPKDCLAKFMSNQSIASDDPCYFDTGAGPALDARYSRSLLQSQDGLDISSIPNYAASATASPAAGSSASSGRNPAASPSPKPASSQNQNPFGSGPAPPALAATSSVTEANGATTVNGGGGVVHDPPAKAAVLAPALPQPIGPDPREYQQTADFPDGGRLTLDQADALFLGRGFH